MGKESYEKFFKPLCLIDFNDRLSPNKLPVNISKIDIDIDLVNKEKINRKEKPAKHQYGTYNNVLLSDVELQKLQSEFPTDWQERIDNVSGYCRSHGKAYKDYLATIRNWARRDARQGNARNDVTAGYQQAMRLIGGGNNG